MRLFPELSGDAQRIDFKVVPPGDFVADLVQLPVMAATERHRELIAHFDTKRARLSEAEMMRVAGVASADDARLRGDKPKVRLVAPALWLGQREGAFINSCLLRDYGRQRRCAGCGLRRPTRLDF